MVALTKEKREELIKDCEFDLKSLANLCTDFPENKSFQSALLRQKIALASLTAECKYFQWKWARDENAVWTTTPIEKLSDAVSAFGKDGENVIYRMLFTAPPVPEIKLPDDNSCEDGLKKHGLRTKSEGISQLSDGFRCGFAWHENEIKRLNYEK